MGKYAAYYDADQLYDLRSDLNEQKNLAADPKHAARLKNMQAELRKRMADLPTPFAEFTKPTSD